MKGMLMEGVLELFENLAVLVIFLEVFFVFFEENEDFGVELE
jgi:hypothetical protein